MAKTTREWFSDTGFDLFVVPKGQTASGDPSRLAIVVTCILLAITLVSALLIAHLGRVPSSGILVGGWLIACVFVNPTYRLYMAPTTELPPRGVESQARFRDVRSAGLIYLAGALATGLTDLRLFPFWTVLWFCVATIYGIRIATIGREISSGVAEVESQIDHAHQ